MKFFIIKILALYALTFITVIGFFSLADGNTDAFYLRFASPKQNSLIIGSSRAAQGIVPGIINSELSGAGANIDIYNFAFALGYSSFGPSYYNCIKKKLDPGSGKGLFIIEVNPWTVSDRSETPEDTACFIENNLPVGRLERVDRRPNYGYLTDHYDQMYCNIIINRIKNMPVFRSGLNTSFLHDDGWFEVSVKMDERSLKQRHKKTIGEYTKTAPKFYNYSNIRFEYLKKTVAYLKERGDVYLVRLPVHEEISAAENLYMSDFNDKMMSVSEQLAVKYIDLSDSNKNVTFTDGNHLYKDSARKITNDIADIIRSQNQRNPLY